MAISARAVGDVTVLDLSGKLTLGDGSAEFRAAVNDLIAANCRRVLLNLEHVPYMDSAGLGELMGGHGRMKAAGGIIKLLNPHKRVYDVLHVTKIHTVFDTYRTEAEALESFQPAP